MISETGEERAMPEAIVPLGRDSVLWGVYDGNIYLYANGVLDTVFLSPFTINENEDFVLENDLWGVRDHRMLEYVNGKPDTSFLLTETREMLFQENAFWVQYSGGISRITQEGVNTYATPSEWKLRYFTCMLRDREGDFWLGSTEGLIKASDEKFKFYTCEDGLTKDLYSLEEDKNGRLIIGGNQGRVFVYEKGDHFISYQPSTVLPAGEIYDIQRDYRGNLWFASYWKGIAHVKDGAIARYFCRDKNDSCMDIYCLYEDRQKNIWVGTWVGMTRLMMDAKADTVRKIIHYWENDNLQFTAKCVVQDNYGTLWFGADEGLFYLDRDSIRVYALPFQTGIEALKIDRRNNLWAATQGVGILHFKIKDGRKLELLNRFTTDNGLASNFLLDLELDNNDNVWAATSFGLSVLKELEEGYHIIHYNTGDGLIDKAYSRLKLYRDSKGWMWGVSPVGLFSFEPDSMTIQNKTLKTQIVKVLFSGREENLYSATNLQSPWHRNIFEVEFRAINLSNPSKTRYSYRLEGLDNNWSSPNDARNLRFNNLSPGKYTFQVKASNADGVWNEQPTSFSFTIKPPFWQTWWFIGGGVMLIGAISVIYVRDRENRLRKEEAEKSRVNQLIAELETRALRAQMNPHFIFNSLNAIQEAILSKEFNTAYAYLFKFSKLLRQVLYSSSKGSIPVETEVEMLNLYLELESLRFDDSFQYKIEVAPDDERRARSILRRLIQEYLPVITDIQTAAGPLEGLHLIKTFQPELLFLDVRMPHMDGFDLLAKLDRWDFEIIFTTSYDEYAIKAIKFSALDYLLKPVDAEELKKAVKKFQEKRAEKAHLYPHLLETLPTIKGRKYKPTRLAIWTTTGAIFLQLNEIVRCEADNNLTCFVLNNGSKVLASKTLKHYDSILSEYRFIRSHRSHLVNLDYVKRYTNDGRLILENGDQVEVSKRKRNRLKEQINEF